MKKLLTLVLAGVAINMFLKSEQGADLRKKLSDWLSDAQDALNGLVGPATEKVEQTARKIDSSLPGNNA